MAQDSIARALALKAISEGGSGGTSDYSELENKPQINSVTLSGNKSLADLGIQGELSAGSNITINNGTISASFDGLEIIATIAQGQTNLTSSQLAKCGAGTAIIKDGKVYIYTKTQNFGGDYGYSYESVNDYSTVALALRYEMLHIVASDGYIWRYQPLYDLAPSGAQDGEYLIKRTKDTLQDIDTWSYVATSTFATTTYVDNAIGNAIGGSY